MRHLWIAIVVVGVLSLGWGIYLGQPSTVKRWATTLCTSCIGLIDRESGR